ncbi:nuclear transport factor 2 family protein [Rhodococcus koreensis]
MSAITAVCQEYFDAVGRGDTATLTTLVTDDFVHELMGSTVFAGKRDIREVSELVVDLRKSTVSGVEFTFESQTEQDDRFAAIVHGRSELMEGGRFDNLYVIFVEIRDGKIARMRELTDTKYTDATRGSAVSA